MLARLRELTQKRPQQLAVYRTERRSDDVNHPVRCQPGLCCEHIVVGERDLDMMLILLGAEIEKTVDIGECTDLVVETKPDR